MFIKTCSCLGIFMNNCSEKTSFLLHVAFKNPVVVHRIREVKED